MAYDEGVAERLREVFAGQANIVEKKMFGGIAFMHAGNMCCGIVNDVLMARVGPDAYEEALTRPGAREMDFTGRSMKGFVYVDPDGFAEDDQLREWVSLCQAFTATLPAKQAKAKC
jgi:TfoX/Sxy family transcriptional regulator of competence genes